MAQQVRKRIFLVAEYERDAYEALGGNAVSGTTFFPKWWTPQMQLACLRAFGQQPSPWNPDFWELHLAATDIPREHQRFLVDCLRKGVPLNLRGGENPTPALLAALAKGRHHHRTPEEHKFLDKKVRESIKEGVVFQVPSFTEAIAKCVSCIQ